MRDRLLRRHSRPERQTDGEAWDRPADEPMDRWLTDAGEGPAWDRPAEEEFAPPLDERMLHWAFEPPSTGRAAKPEWGAAHEHGGLADDTPADDAPADDAPLHWALREPEVTPRAIDEVYERDDSVPLVSVPRTDTGRPPRDPAQAGMFAPDDAFAPVVEGLTARRPPIPRAVEPTLAPHQEGTSRAPSGASVFGDMFGATVRPGDVAAAPPADFVVRPSVADLPSSLPDAPPVAARAPAADERDPLEWPPIPNGFLPPVAHQAVREPAAAAVTGGEHRLRSGPEVEHRSRPRGVAVLTIAGTALTVIALLLLVLQLVASGTP